MQAVTIDGAQSRAKVKLWRHFRLEAELAPSAQLTHSSVYPGLPIAPDSSSKGPARLATGEYDVTSCGSIRLIGYSYGNLRLGRSSCWSLDRGRDAWSQSDLEAL